MSTIINIEPDACVVCLAFNTALWPLGEYLQLYKMLLGKENDMDNTDIKPFTCSDCQDMFHKIQIFQQKLRSSQDIMLMKLNSRPRLSRNNIDMKTEYDKFQADHDIEIEVDNGYYKPNDDCKDEPYDDSIDNQFDAEDNVIENIKQEPDDEETAQFKIKDEIVVKKHNKSTKDKKYVESSSRKNVTFNLVTAQELLKRNFRWYHKRRVSCDKDVRAMDEEARLTWKYRHSKFKCFSCVKGFKENESLQKHIQNKHSESVGEYVCDICEVRTTTKESLQSHVRQHYYQHECSLCGQTQYKKWHLRMHFLVWHKKLYECPACGTIIKKRREFFRHYRMMHQRFICDYCGKCYKDRHWFENHIFKVHKTFECKQCDKTFAYFRNFDAHNKLLHTAAASESTYCVECDVQFPNRARYNRHINTSTRHLGRNRKKKSANCPECGKLYACRTNMMNHYRLEHLKVTNYQCKDCSRFFLNSYRLKEHRLVNHEKKGRAKNKFCSYCGRGFSNNRILLYHVRTHTGERPHACQHCSATFAQPFALHTHVKARHKDVMMK